MGATGNDYVTIAYATGTGATVWGKSYIGPGNSSDYGYSVAVSPDSSKVFVTGESYGGSSTGYDYATIGINATTGGSLWLRRYNGPGSSTDSGQSVVVSPDGSKVFVTGYSEGESTYYDYATIAYDAVTGVELWAARFSRSPDSDDEPWSLAVSPDGSRVFVTGFSTGPTSQRDWATVAYDAITGTPVWVKRHNGPAKQDDNASDLAVSPDGTTLFVVGTEWGTASFADAAIVAYSTSDGTARWARRYDGPAHKDDYAISVAVAPDGTEVYLTGGSSAVSGASDYVTMAFGASDGTKRWLRRYNGPARSEDNATDLQVTPDVGMVVVTGWSMAQQGQPQYTTIAYDSSSGATVWVTRSDQDAYATDVAISADGTQAFVTGEAGSTPGFDYSTVAYSVATGDQLWGSRYDGTGHNDDEAIRLSPSPTGDAVYVTGSSLSPTGSFDWATVAYAAESQVTGTITSAQTARPI
jgi:DNA-binding beta-propeller fold protein YncE